MTRPPFEVADIIRQVGTRFIDRYYETLTWVQLKVLTAIERCRTAALGGHRDRCIRCGYEATSYCSCRNRHCPKCQTNAREKWLPARQRELLPVGYHHLVFILPHGLLPVYALCSCETGSCMPSRPFVDLSTCCNTWLATRIVSPSLIAGCSRSMKTTCLFAGRTMPITASSGPCR